MSLECLTPPEIGLIIPARDEVARGLATTIAHAHEGLSREYGSNYEIWVAENGSTDNTALVAEEAGAKVLRLEKAGKGAAVRAGMLACRADFRAFMDADGSFKMDDIIRLLDLVMTDADIAVAERSHGIDMADPHASRWRAFGSHFISTASHIIVPTGVKDPQCGAKAFVGSVADKLFGQAKIDKYAGDIEALFMAKRLGYKIVSQVCDVTPIDDSKVRAVDGLRILWDCLGIRLNYAGRQN